MLTQQFVWFSL